MKYLKYMFEVAVFVGMRALPNGMIGNG